MSFSTAQMEDSSVKQVQASPFMHRMSLSPPENKNHSMDTSALKMRLACNNAQAPVQTIGTSLPVEIKILDTDDHVTSSVHAENQPENQPVTVTYSNAKEFAANYYASRMQVGNSHLNHDHVHEALHDHKMHVESLLAKANNMSKEQTLHSEALLDHKEHAELVSSKVDKIAKEFKSIRSQLQTHEDALSNHKNSIEGVKTKLEKNVTAKSNPTVTTAAKQTPSLKVWS